MYLIDFIKELAEDEKKASKKYIEIKNLIDEKYWDTSEKISKEELLHYQKLQNIINGVVNTNCVVDDSIIKLKKELDQKLIEKEKTLNKSSKKSFFLFALQQEKDSVLIYTKLRDVLNENCYKNEMNSLIKEESSHISFIMSLLHETK